MVREFDTFSCSLVCGDYFGSSQAFPQGSGGLLQQVVIRREAIYEGDNLWFTQIAMGDDPGGVARGAVVGPHGSSWGAAGLNVVLDKCSLLRRELTVW